MDSIYGFPYIEPSLHPWDEAYLIVVDDHFYVFVDSGGKNFIEYFIVKIHKGNWPEILFLFGSLRGFCISVIVASSKELGTVPSISIWWNILRVLV